MKTRKARKPTRNFALAFCAALLGSSPLAAQTASCALATVPISTNPDGRITIPVTLEDHPLSFLVDTGGVSTTIKWEEARELGLAVKQTNRRLKGVAGSVLNFAIASENFSIAALRVRNRPIYIESRPLAGADGTLAPDILRSYDVDIDLARASLALMSPTHCTPVEGATAIAIDVGQDGHVRFPVKIDGKAIIATLDTGSVMSLIGMRTAALLGVYPNAAELKLLHDTGQYRFHTYPFQTLEIGGVTVKNPRIAIASDNFLPGSDLILGIDALRRMHLTIAYGENRLYIAAQP
jgi:predicted aspartyl protease